VEPKAGLLVACSLLWDFVTATATQIRVSGGVRGHPNLTAARRWEHVPAPSRRSVWSGTLAAGSRRNDDEAGELVAHGASTR
jgi:hypothetical protein